MSEPKIEPSPKRIRAFIAGRVVIDTYDAKLVWEHAHYPWYYVPLRDVRQELLPPGAIVRTIPELAEHARIDWGAMEAWFEEDEQVYVHPHDPYKRIDILRSSRHVEVFLGDVKLAETRSPTMLFETGAPVRTYIPKIDVRMDLLEPTDLRTGCAYKGFARYWRVRGTTTEIAWAYDTPLAEAVKIAGLVAFYDERVRIVVS